MIFGLNLISCLDLVPKRQQMVGFGLDWGKWFRIVWHSCAGFEFGIYNEFTARHSVSGRWRWDFKWAPSSYFPLTRRQSQSRKFESWEENFHWMKPILYLLVFQPFALSQMGVNAFSLVKSSMRLIWSLLGIPLKGFALSLQVDKWPQWMRARPQDCDSFLLQSSHLRFTSSKAPVIQYTCSVPRLSVDRRLKLRLSI